MPKFTITYDQVTPESIENGDAADNGWWVPGGWVYSLCGENRDELLEEARSGEYDLDFREAIEHAGYMGISESSSGLVVTKGNWFESSDSDQDGYRYYLHCDGVTISTKRRIWRYLNGKRVLGGARK